MKPTPEQAREIIEGLKIDYRLKDNTVPSQNMAEALQMGADALEKQIPKKPNEVNYLLDLWGADKGIETQLRCPNCEHILITKQYTRSTKTEEISDEKSAYCPECGQKIDWGDN